MKIHVKSYQVLAQARKDKIQTQIVGMPICSQEISSCMRIDCVYLFSLPHVVRSVVYLDLGILTGLKMGQFHPRAFELEKRVLEVRT